MTLSSLPPGNYIVVVDGASGTSGNFIMDFDLVPPPTVVTESEPNDGTGSADPIPSLPATVSGTLSDLTADYFVVSLPSSAVGKVVRVQMTAGSADVAVDLRNSGGTVLGTSPNLYSNGVWTTPTISTSGTYYFRVFDPSGSYYETYTLQFSLQ